MKFCCIFIPLYPTVGGRNNGVLGKGLGRSRLSTCLTNQCSKTALKEFLTKTVTFFDVRHICETPVTEQTFIEQLHELHHKIDFAKEQSFKGALSVSDVGDVLEKLKVKVM